MQTRHIIQAIPVTIHHTPVLFRILTTISSILPIFHNLPISMIPITIITTTKTTGMDTMTINIQNKMKRSLLSLFSSLLLSLLCAVLVVVPSSVTLLTKF